MRETLMGEGIEAEGLMMERSQSSPQTTKQAAKAQDKTGEAVWIPERNRKA